GLPRAAGCRSTIAPAGSWRRRVVALRPAGDYFKHADALPLQALTAISGYLHESRRGGQTLRRSAQPETTAGFLLHHLRTQGGGALPGNYKFYDDHYRPLGDPQSFNRCH
ncbi:hypothetical protein U8L64_00545, partial [Pseudomonas sp. FIP_A4]